MLTNQNGRRVEVGEEEGNCRRTGQERYPQVALERGSCLQRRKCISNAKVMGHLCYLLGGSLDVTEKNGAGTVLLCSVQFQD